MVVRRVKGDTTLLLLLLLMQDSEGRRQRQGRRSRSVVIQIEDTVKMQYNCTAFLNNLEVSQRGQRCYYENNPIFHFILYPLVYDYLVSINNEYFVKLTYIPLEVLCQNV